MGHNKSGRPTRMIGASHEPPEWGWCLVRLGGIGTVGGYFATSELSALLRPHFGWRIMWLVGFPTGLLLVALSPLHAAECTG
jgi:hypothetical protein